MFFTRVTLYLYNPFLIELSCLSNRLVDTIIDKCWQFIGCVKRFSSLCSSSNVDQKYWDNFSGGAKNFIESGQNFDRKFICDIIYK